MNRKEFNRGLIAGIPIGLGYLSVSFAFGMMAISLGLSVPEAILISATNLTSAGQFAGIQLIANQAVYLEIIFTTLTINLRYALMSLSLSMKIDEKMTRFQRMLCSFSVTDEIFALAVMEDKINGSYFFGLSITPFIGWTLGTTLGALFSTLLPDSVASAMNIALYCMFIAIVLPQAKQEKNKRIAMILSAICSILLTYLPIFSFLTSGWRIIVVTILVAAFMAYQYPVEVSHEHHD